MKPRGQPKKRPEPVPIALSPEEIALVRSLVIYEDPHIMALNKPSGLSSQGGRGQVKHGDHGTLAVQGGEPDPLRFCRRREALD